MPSATDQDRDKMIARFGSIDDTGPIQALLDAGYSFPRGGMIIAPPGHTPTESELECVYFLCDEWDYGWDPRS